MTNTNTIGYVLKALRKNLGSGNLYRFKTVPNRTLDEEEFARALAERMHKSVSEVLFFLRAQQEVLESQMKNGNCVKLGWINLEPTISSSVKGCDGKVDASNKIYVQGVVAKSFRQSVQDCLHAVPLDGSATPSRLFELMEKGADELNHFVKPNTVITLNGMNIQMNVARSDEGVWLEDAAHNIVARASIIKNDRSICDFKFSELPPAGSYVLVLSLRNGEDETHAVRRVMRVVEVG